jgi:hypothetical protein
VAALEFSINLAGNFASALENANKNLGETGKHAHEAGKEVEFFEGEVGSLKAGLGGLEFNLSALAKGGSLFTFDLAEGLKSVYEAIEHVVDKVVELGVEMVKVAGETQDLNLAVKLNVGDEKAKEIDELAEGFERTTRFDASDIKRSLLPLLKQGISDPQLLDDIATIGTDMAARTGKGIAEVQRVTEGFASIFQKGRLKSGGLEAFGIAANDYWAELGHLKHVSAETAAKMAKAGKINQNELVRLAINMVGEREGGIGGQSLDAGKTLGATLDRLGNLKKNLFEGLAQSPGMQAVQGTLDNLIAVAKGPIGKELIANIGGAFESIFKPFTGPDGKAKLEEVIHLIGKKLGDAVKWVGEKAVWLGDAFDKLPGIIDKIVTAAEILATVWAGAQIVGTVTALSTALPALGAAAGALVSPFGAAAAAIGGLVAALYAMHHQYDETSATIDKFNKAHPVDAEAAKVFGTEFAREHKAKVRHGGMQVGDFGSVDDLPAMAGGGIVSSPTVALIGEAGPEAVVPLGPNRRALANMGGGGAWSGAGGNTFHASATFVINGVSDDSDVKVALADFEQRWRAEAKKLFDETSATYGGGLQ